MSTLSAEMKFEVSDVVYFRGAPHCGGTRPNGFVITERLVQQCHGGIQKSYRLAGEAHWFAEHSLQCEEPEYIPMSDAALADRQRIALADAETQAEICKEMESVNDARWAKRDALIRAAKENKTDG